MGQIAPSDFVVPEQLELVSIRQFALTHPEILPVDVGVELTRKLKKSDLQGFAVRYVSDLVEEWRRYEARRVEVKSERPVFKPDTNYQRVGYESRRKQEEEEIFQDWFDHPQIFHGNKRQRLKFAEWCGDRFGDWYKRGLALAESFGRKEADYFRWDWDEDGGQNERFGSMWSNLMKTWEEEVERVRLETTKELLSSSFALGDGTQVTWGSATVEQHDQRIKMLMKNVEGTMETAVRHGAAVKMIQTAGVKCLAEVAGK